MGSDVMLQGVGCELFLLKLNSCLPFQPLDVLPGQCGIEHGLDVLDQRISTRRFTVNVRFLDNVIDIRKSVFRKVITHYCGL
jgi:hypothetical protein